MSAPRGSEHPLQVSAVRCHVHRAPLLRPFVTAKRRTEAVDYVVAEVELADGTIGQGSAAETVAVTGEDAATILTALGGPIRAALEGATGTVQELSSLIAGALPRATSAKAAAEVALHDAWARSAGVPLRALLRPDSPGRPRPGSTAPPPPTASSAPVRLLNDMTVSLEEPTTMARRAAEARADGYRVLKIKLGRDVDEDRRRLAAVLDAVPDARLRLDANQGWGVAEAIAVITRLEADGLPVDLVEQPVEATDLAGMAQVRSEVATPIMADEAVWTAADARRIVQAGAADLLNIKLAKTGGLQEALALADVAQDASLECMVGAMMEPKISITAAAHLAAAHPAVTMIDLDSALWFATDLPAGGYLAEDGHLLLENGPGLALDRLHETADAAPCGVGTAPGAQGASGPTSPSGGADVGS